MNNSLDHRPLPDVLRMGVPPKPRVFLGPLLGGGGALGFGGETFLASVGVDSADVSVPSAGVLPCFLLITVAASYAVF